MSYYEGLSCPVCATPFAPEDDIVVCPRCGLPHHRTCWKSIGHCYEQDKHGTAQQWSRDAASASTDADTTAAADHNVCPKCHTENAQYAEFCSRCGCELTPDDWHSAPQQTPPVQEYAPFRAPFTSETYTATEKLDGVSSEDLAHVVGINTAYYMPRFQRMDRGNAGGWNWAACLLSPYWLFYRKQYGLGAIYFTILMLIKVAVAFLPTELTDPATLITYYGLAGLWLGMSVLMGVKGNAFYFAHCKRQVRKTRADVPDISSIELGTRGGVAAGIAVLFVALEEVGGLLIATIIPNLL